MTLAAEIKANAARVVTTGRYAGMGHGEPSGLPCKHCGTETVIAVCVRGNGRQDCSPCIRRKAEAYRAEHGDALRERAAQRRRDRPSKYRESQRRHAQRYPFRVLRNKIRSRAKAVGIPCDLTAQDIREMHTEQCPCCGVVMDYDNRTSPNGAEMDRLIPAKGYTSGNVEFLCRQCNNWKSNMTSGELRMVLRYVEQRERRAL